MSNAEALARKTWPLGRICHSDQTSIIFIKSDNMVYYLQHKDSNKC
jgi:hypothetical protein